MLSVYSNCIIRNHTMIYDEFLTINILHYIILYHIIIYAAELELILGGSLLADHLVTQTTWQLG